MIKALISGILLLSLQACISGGAYTPSSSRYNTPSEDRSWGWELNSNTGELEYCRKRQGLLRICL